MWEVGWRGGEGGAPWTVATTSGPCQAGCVMPLSMTPYPPVSLHPGETWVPANICWHGN